jgi:hypothetical protein
VQDRHCQQVDRCGGRAESLDEGVFGREGEDLREGYGTEEFGRQRGDGRRVVSVGCEDLGELWEESWYKGRYVGFCVDERTALIML